MVEGGARVAKEKERRQNLFGERGKGWERSTSRYGTTLRFGWKKSTRHGKLRPISSVHFGDKRTKLV